MEASHSRNRWVLFAGAAFASMISGPAPTEASPVDTRLIVYESWSASNPDVWIMGGDGAQPRQLTTDPASDQGPVWSPDGTRIAFFSVRDGDAEIFTMAADGSDVIQVTRNGSFDAYPVWGPTGRLAYVSNRGSGSTNEIWTSAPDGAGATRLTHNTWTDAYPAWTPGGQVLFVSNPPVDGAGGRLSQRGEIFRMDADGSGVTRLTNNLCEDHAPSASPDGTRITFASDCGRAFTGVHVMSTDGSNVRALTHNADIEDWPTWSPDGNQIVYASTRDAGMLAGGDIVVMNADGSAPHNLTRTVDVFEGLPWFSPIGSTDQIGRGHIAFGQVLADTRSITVLSELFERSTGVGVDEGIDGFFLPAPDSGTAIRTVTTDRSGIGFALNINFHDSERIWIGACSPPWFVGQPNPRIEVQGCVVPQRTATLEVSADHGVDLDVTVVGV
jgi:TolB protein